MSFESETKGGKKSIHDKRQAIKNRSALREMNLEKSFEADEEGGDSQPLRRVIIEALDFDWIFHGENAKIFMELLANKSNDQVLNKKSIKIVIELMWSHYQPSIIKYIFFPYFMYLASISVLASGFCGRLVLINYEIKET